MDDGLAMSGIDDCLGYDDFGDDFSDDDIREDDKDVNGKLYNDCLRFLSRIHQFIYHYHLFLCVLYDRQV